MTESNSVLTLRQVDGAAYIGFNRPRQRNAYNRDTILALDATLRQIALDQSIRCVVLHGDEDAFCSGGDLREVRELADEGALALRERWFQPLLRLSQRLLTLPAPTIASARGLVLAGGLELACCCDLIVTTDESRLGDQHINAGLIPGGGATDLLARRIGTQRAMELMLTGRQISGTEAVSIGLALWSEPEASFNARLEQLVATLTSKRAEALRSIKLLVGPNADVQAMRQEGEMAARDMSSEAVRELLHSFGRRKPEGTQ